MNRSIRGVISIVMGVAVIIATATGGYHTQDPNQGYIVGGLIIVFGIVRVVMAQSR